MKNQTNLLEKKCKPCRGEAPALTQGQIRENIKELQGWGVKNKTIVKTFPFENYYETVSFVNAVAWIANQADHHPDILFGYKTCQITYTTHSANGLTENDFICAAKTDALVK